MTENTEAAAIEAAARALAEINKAIDPHLQNWLPDAKAAIAAYTASMKSQGWQMMPREPTKGMLIGARDWSGQAFGKPIGNDAANGCWHSMFDQQALKDNANG